MNIQERKEKMNMQLKEWKIYEKMKLQGGENARNEKAKKV